MLKKILVGVMIFCLTFTTFLATGSNEVQAASWKPLESGWKYRVDGPDVDGGKENDYHVHVQGKVGKRFVDSAETVNGDISHKTTFKKDGVPKWVQEKVKETKDFKKAKEKQKNLEKERNKVKKLSWSQILLKPTLIAGLAATLGVSVWKIITGGLKSLVYG